jgi:hypothetical protein
MWSAATQRGAVAAVLRGSVELPPSCPPEPRRRRRTPCLTRSVSLSAPFGESAPHPNPLPAPPSTTRGERGLFSCPLLPLPRRLCGGAGRGSGGALPPKVNRAARKSRPACMWSAATQRSAVAAVLRGSVEPPPRVGGTHRRGPSTYEGMLTATMTPTMMTTTARITAIHSHLVGPAPERAGSAAGAALALATKLWKSGKRSPAANAEP